MARRRSLLGKSARRITGIPSPPRDVGLGAKGSAPAGAGDTAGPAYGEPAAAPELDAPTVTDDPSEPQDELAADDALLVVEDSEVPEDGPDSDALPDADDLPDSDDMLEDDDLPDSDDMLEDESPLIGAELSVPIDDADALVDEAGAPQDRVAHMHSATRSLDESSDGSPLVDDELLLFDDENPTEEIVVDPAVLDSALENEDIDPHTLAPEDVDPLDDSGASDEDSLPGFEDDEDPPAAAVAAVSATDSIADDDTVVAEGAPASLPDMSLPDLPGLPDDDGPRGAAVFADDGSGDSFFGDEEEDPPTEDSVGPLPQDFSSLYRAPMDVPEPPPIPGILDRYTPAPVRNQGARSSSGYVPVPPKNVAAPIITPPVGLWNDPPSSGGMRANAKDTPPPASYKAAPVSEEEGAFYRDTWFLVAVVVAALLALALLIGLAYVQNGRNAQAQDTGTVPVNVEAPAAPDADRPPADLVPTPEDPDIQVVDPSAATPPVVRPELPVTAEPGLRPPTPTVADRPASPVVTAPPTPVGRTGRLKIRAAKQVLVYVNGQPVGLTPLDLDRPAGKYSVSARVSGQQRTERVELSSGTIRLVEF